MKRRLDHETDIPKRSRARTAADAIAIACMHTGSATTSDLVTALLKLEPAALTVHEGAIVTMLTNSCAVVREKAKCLFRCRLEYPKLTPHAGGCVHTSHAGALVDLLTDSTDSVRLKAIYLFASEYALEMLTPAVIAMARSAITNMLDDTNYRIRNEVKYALDNLKKKLVQFHWATVRAFVYLIRPYAMFWYEYTGKQLCAPGGKWAARDCAAYEAELSDERRQ